MRVPSEKFGLADISLPETIQNLLADELIKTMKVPGK